MSSTLKGDLALIPLTTIGLEALDGIFEEQANEWLMRLRWDYTNARRLLAQALLNRDLFGFAALAGGSPVGFAFYVLEGPRCSIGDIYVSRSFRDHGADRRLAEAMIEKARSMPRLRRIECQSVSFGNASADGYLVSEGFHRFERLFMVRDLTGINEPETQIVNSGNSAASVGDIRIRDWDQDDFGRAAEAIHRSYQAEDDRLINIQYRTEEGCAELLSILTETIWCGEFLPRASKVAIERRTGKLLGVAVASRISDDTGHLGQISVLPDYQGRGLGRQMIGEVVHALQRHGLMAVSLAVTATNHRALKLYKSVGFQNAHRFPVYYWQRN